MRTELHEEAGCYDLVSRDGKLAQGQRIWVQRLIIDGKDCVRISNNGTIVTLPTRSVNLVCSITPGKPLEVFET